MAGLLLWKSRRRGDAYDLGCAAVPATTRVRKREWKNPSIGLLPQNALGRARGESYTVVRSSTAWQVALAKCDWAPQRSLQSDSNSRVSANTDPLRHLAGEKISVCFGGYPMPFPLIRGSFHDVSTVRHAVARLDVRSRSAELLAGRISKMDTITNPDSCAV